MNHFDRIFFLRNLLAQRHIPIPLSEIEKKLECSRATANRTIKALRDTLNAPLVYDRDQNGYYFAKGDVSNIHFELPGLWLNASELHALLVSDQLLSEVQPGLLKGHIKPLRSRIEKLLEKGRFSSEIPKHRIRILRTASRPANREVFCEISTALLGRKRLHILYHDRTRDRTTERDLSPQRIVYYRDNWYLDAWCHLRQGLRTFSLDRIHPVYVDEQDAINIAKEELDTLLTKTYGIFSGTPKHTAVLHFSPDAAKWVADEYWHPRQQGRILKNGGYELKIPYGNPTELIRDILKYGPDVEVVRPKSLRQAVLAKLGEMVKVYG